MAKPRIVQVLCPARHCITALPYEPGVTKIYGSVVTPEKAAEMIKLLVDWSIAVGQWNPWCGLCHAPRAAWIFEDSPLAFETLEEALPHLVESARKQAFLREMLERSKN